MQSAVIFPFLHARGGPLGLNCMRLVAIRQKVLACIAASQMQNLHALAAITMQSRQFFVMRQGD